MTMPIDAKMQRPLAKNDEKPKAKLPNGKEVSKKGSGMDLRPLLVNLPKNKKRRGRRGSFQEPNPITSNKRLKAAMNWLSAEASSHNEDQCPHQAVQQH